MLHKLLTFCVASILLMVGGSVLCLCHAKQIKVSAPAQRRGNSPTSQGGTFCMPQPAAKTKDKVQKIQRGLGVASDGAYGPKTRSALMDQFRGPMSEAVKFAENNKRNHGVLSVKTTNPSRVLNTSVTNNLDRFMRGQTANENYDNSGTPRFVDFMQQRWAPVPAPNDPEGLNKNWAPNVRHYLKTKYPGQYQQWRDMNLVRRPTEISYA